MNELAQRHCQHTTTALNSQQVHDYLSQIQGWQLVIDEATIQREFSFKNYLQTLAFVNAVAEIANREDHHPDICFGYNRCEVHYTTHSANGLSENDFICAAQIDALFTDI